MAVKDITSDVATLLNPASAPKRQVSAGIGGGQVGLGNVDSKGDGKLFDAPKKELGKQDFLTLLVTQLKHQDPLQPTENTEFVAQLAQFSSLEGTQNIVSSIETLSSNLQGMIDNQKASAESLAGSSATNLIGKQVRVEAKSIMLDPTKDPNITIDVFAEAGEQAVVSIVDDKQNIVNAIQLTKAGDSQITWNGTRMDGTKAAGGKYTVMVTSTDGKRDLGYTYLQDRVTGLRYSKEGVRFEVRGQEVGMESVVRVGEAPADGKDKE